MDSPESTNDQSYLNRAVEISIRLGLLAALLGWCFLILSPFFSLLLWGIIIAVAVYPLFSWLKTRFRGRGKLASFIVTFTLLSILLIPSWMLTDSLFQGCLLYTSDAADE